MLEMVVYEDEDGGEMQDRFARTKQLKDKQREKLQE